jgi:hypothetical protein
MRFPRSTSQLEVAAVVAAASSAMAAPVRGGSRLWFRERRGVNLVRVCLLGAASVYLVPRPVGPPTILYIPLMKSKAEKTTGPGWQQ